MVRLGVDYGTTNTVVVCSDRGRYPVVPHIAETSVGPVARETFPSLVVYDRDKDRFLFGAHAERSLYAPGAAERFGVIQSLKRLLRNYGEGQRVGWDMVPSGYDPGMVLRAFAEAVAASVRKSGLFDADEEVEAVITWPAHANGAQRFLTRRSFREAGFRVIAGLNEPSAAAIEFADRMVRGNRAKARKLSLSIAVFDLGGGTFDVSLVKIDGADFTVLDAAGIEELGGDDFDLVLARLFTGKMKIELDELRPFQRTLLVSHARQQKESISSGAVRSLTFSPQDIGLSGRVCTVGVPFYFQQLEVLLQPALEKLLALVNGPAARAAGISSESLNAIYLVGGSSKLPLIPRKVAERFPKTQLVITDKPFSSTAMGAAIHSSEEVRLHDILGRTFGVVRLSEHGRREYFCPIFPAGIPLPKPGFPPLQHSVTYSPEHNIGHLRYLECSAVDQEGQPAEGVRLWSETIFPYDPSIPVGGHLAPQGIVPRPDLLDKLVQETYSCDQDGVITVNIRRCCDGQSLSCEIFRS
jgi:molecular chaperone DnaK (HSP70)